ncbi:NADPH:quinone oxidoreductase [Rubrobacter xylanophilus]|uniref:NADPH:quinone oxidoreductase n=1 Tax=Rubrobacter xylanophilus TaxID=49319 RepID=A0A510HJN2_9ACTN|nr:NAD(P)-dependent alcohol dehydrogenase [Rubrobacter xylanophilus]BBL80219.1 NADPH:quinone oxidoreductase [Rubrobacter xylanophilus]
MRVYELRGRGLESLALTERPEPRPGPGQVLVRMRAASLNYRDLLVARGRYGRGPVKLPLVPLSDGAGEVVEVGPAVSRFNVGDRVAGAFFQRWVDGPLDEEKAASALGGAVDGVLAEYVVFEETGVVKIPDHLSFEEASTLPCAGVTAWVGLRVLGNLGPGETVLAMGTGGVSIFALQFAKMAGARVILTSSSDEKLERGKRLGADEAINYEKTPDWDLRARELTGGRGVDHILEVGGAKTLPRSLRAVREGGHITLVGLLGGERADLEEAAKNDRGIRVDSVYVGSLRHFEAMLKDVESARLRPVVDRVFPFEEAREAYEYLQSGRHFGKVVVRI